MSPTQWTLTFMSRLLQVWVLVAMTVSSSTTSIWQAWLVVNECVQLHNLLFLWFLGSGGWVHVILSSSTTSMLNGWSHLSSMGRVGVEMNDSCLTESVCVCVHKHVGSRMLMLQGKTIDSMHAWTEPCIYVSHVASKNERHVSVSV